MKKRLAQLGGLFLLFLMVGVAFAQTITNVYVASQTATTATIVWTTNTPATSQVVYGLNTPGSYPYSTPVNQTLVTSHSVTMIVLTPGQAYNFAAVSGSTQSAGYQFTMCGGNSPAFIPATGTVNNYYQYGSFTMTWNPPTGSSGTPTVCGQAMPTTASGPLSGGASLAASVGDSYKATPGPGTWTIRVQDIGDLSPISVTYPLSAQNSDISAQLSAAAAMAGLVDVIANTITQTCYPAFVCSGGGGSGFPIHLGSTLIAANSTTTAVTGLEVNGVTLTAAGSASLFLNQAGGYTAPGGGVTSIIPSTNITCSPEASGSCVGAVTISASGGSGSCDPMTAGYLLLSTVGGCANSTADYGLSTSGTYTFPAPIAITDTTLPSQINFTPNSHAAATVSGAASLGVPSTVTTPSVLLLPAAPCTGYLEAATDTSGIMPITCGSGGGISPIVYFVSQQCSGATTTDLTIGLQANGSASTDISTCLAGLMANATPTQPIDVVIDKGYKGHINIPVAGNVTIEGLGGGISNTPITACSIVSNVATLTAKNTMVAGTNVLFSGMSTCTALNVAAGGIAPYFTVLSSGLSATQFEVNITTGNVSGAEAGYASYLEGTGLFAPNGLNNDVINVAPNSTLIPSGQSGLPPQRGANVTIKNLVLNGNRRDGTLGNSTTGDPRGNNSVSWYTDIHIWSINNVNIDHVVAYNSPSYALLCDNCGHVRVTNSDAIPFLIGQTVTATNQDGWHINGNSNDIYFSNDYMRTGDDALALNAPEGWCGPITNVTAVNIELHQAQDGGRAYTESAACANGLNPIVSKVSFDNWQGDVNNAAFLFGLETTHTISLNNSITDFTWENSNITAGQGFVVDDSIGNLTFDNVNLRGISNSTAEGFINPIVVTSPISSLTLNNDTLTRTPSGNIAVGAINASTTGAANISTLHIEGFKIVDEGASYGSTSGLLVLNGSTPSTITNANLGLNDYANISATQIGGTVSNYNDLTIPGISTSHLNVNSGTTSLAAGFYSSATTNLAVNFVNTTSKNWDVVVEGPLAGVHAGEFQFYDNTDSALPLSLTPTGISATGITGTGLTVNGATALNGNTSVGGTGGVNYGINFGTNYGALDLTMYDGGAAGRYGWGLTAGTMNFVVPSLANSGGHVVFTDAGDLGAGNPMFTVTRAVTAIPSTGVFGATSGASSSGTCDTGLSRDSAGVWDVGNCTAGDKSGSMNLTNLTVTGTCTGCGGSSPLTTKGDLYGYSSTNARIPVGTDGQILTADSTQTLGLKWATGGSGSSNPTTCTVNSGTDICVTLAPYYASNSGLTTTTVSGTWTAGTSGSVGSCSTFLANEGVYIAGAGAASANYIGTVVSCTGSTMTVTPATSTTVSSSNVVQHDESAAIQAAVTALASTGGTIYFPNGNYLVNGPLQDTSGANSIILMPSIPLITNETVTRFAGFETPTSLANLSPPAGAIIQTQATSGNVFGGYCHSGCSELNFTNAGLQIENFTLIAPTNPSVTMIGASWIATARFYHVAVGTTNISGTPTNSGAGIVFPLQGNDVRLSGQDLYVSGYGTCVQTGEHTTITELGISNCIKAIVPESRAGAPYAGNMAHIVHAWVESSTYGVAASAHISALKIDDLDLENVGTNGIYDPSNLIYGDIGFNVQSSTGAITPNNPAVNGAANLCIHNIQFPNAATFGGACTVVASSSNGSASYYSLQSLLDSWQGQEGSGTTLLNSGSDYANTLTAANVTWASATGFTGNVATYNGTTSYSTAAANDTYDGSTPFSACSWINPSSIGGAAYTIAGDFPGSGTSVGWMMEVAGFASNDVLIYLSNSISGNNYIETRGSTTPITVGQANLACFTTDGTKNVSGVKINVNGVNQSLGTASNTLTGSIVSSLPDTIGNQGGATSGSQFFPGAIGRTMKFNRVLSTSEMLEMYNLGPSAYTSIPSSGGIGGSGTSTFIPKFTASTTVGNSALLDNGTNIIGSEPIFAGTPIGSSGWGLGTFAASGPANIGAQSGTGTWAFLTTNSGGSPGFIFDSSHNMTFATSTANTGVGYAPFFELLGGTGTLINSGEVMGWGSVSGSTYDTGLSRDSAGVVDVGNGTAGNKSGTINAANYGSGALANGMTATTQSTGDNSTKVATTAYVDSNSAHPHIEYANIAPGLFVTNTIVGPVFYEPVQVAFKALIARLSGTISCTGAPTIGLYDLGTSPTTTFGSVLGTVDSVATGTSDGVYITGPTSVNMVAGHYYGYAFSAGTCVTAPTFDITATVQ